MPDDGPKDLYCPIITKTDKSIAMKKRITLCILLFAAIILTQCGNDDEKPKTPPEVTTTTPNDITTTSALTGGTITSDGNAGVTASGVVYSSTVAMPTLADDKLSSTATTGNFSVLLENLSSGTTYHIRAYATNSVGTGYGDIVNFTTGNAAPTATNVTLTGDVEVGKTLTASYTYFDSEGDVESGSTYQWYVAPNATGDGEAAIPGATDLTYTIEESQQDKYVRFGIAPKAASGTALGVEVKSAFVGAVGEASTVTFVYNGTEVTYGIINSAATGKKWLDRNLGAPNVASGFDDYMNYGDLFQWGRLADGHQLVTRTGPEDADMHGVNGMTSVNIPYEYSSTDVPGHGLFIIIPNGELPADWRKPQNNNLWQSGTGTNNPCPTGWRVPTQVEWIAENLNDIEQAYTNLKLTLTGVRNSNASGFSQSTNGNYWSSTIDFTNDPTSAVRIRINTTVTPISIIRSQGYACRCIKD